MQSAITSNATGIGKIVSTAIYGAGIQAAQGLVDGLKSQDKALSAAITHLADLLVTQLKTDLKIHSPSQVMHAHGQHIGQGLANGIASTGDLVSASLASLVGPVTVGGDGASVSGTWANLLASAPGPMTSPRSVPPSVVNGGHTVN